MRPVLALCISCFTLACTPEPEAPARPRRHPVAVRAPYDLNCPRNQLVYDQLDNSTMGVSGCGRRATYVRLCQDRVTKTWGNNIDIDVECRWLLNASQ